METTHTPSFLASAVKENNMILSKENREIVALSGRDGFGSNKPTFEADIESADVLDFTSLQLRGLFNVLGDYSGALKLKASAYSLIEQIDIEINGQPVLELHQDSPHVAQLNRNFSESVDEYDIDALQALEGVALQDRAARSFSLDLSRYGSKLEYYMITGSVSKLKIRIRFQSQTEQMLFGAVTDPVTAVSGYVLNDLRLTADFMTFQADAYQAIIKRMRSPRGIKMACHTFVPSRNALQPTALTHRVQGSYQYRNVISVFYLPVATTVTRNSANISTVDDVSNLKYVAGNYPLRQRIRYAGGDYVNQNASGGCSNKMEHYSGVLKSSLVTPNQRTTAHGLTKKYSTDDYQVTAGNWLRGNDNFVSITNSGINGFASRGILEVEFDTANAQPGITLLTVAMITLVVEASDGQIRVMK